MLCLQVYLFEKSPSGNWAQSAALSPTAALSEAGGQAGKLSAAFKDKLALFKGHTSHVCLCTSPLHCDMEASETVCPPCGQKTSCCPYVQIPFSRMPICGTL